MPALLSVHTRSLSALANDSGEHHLARFAPQNSGSAAPGVWEIPLRSLDPEPLAELWCTDRPVHAQQADEHFAWREHSELAMGELRLSLSDASDLYSLARLAYTRLLQWLADRPGWTLWRVWHFFPAIHQGTGDQERYRRFVSGRHAEFERFGLPPSAYPAATVIGSADGDLVMHFLAGRAPTVALENPRQVSAYCYPKQYGPHSPTFARARHLRKPSFSQVPLLVSGTSSVVGHRSTHIGDWKAQLRDTLQNLHTLSTQTQTALQAESARLYLTSEVPPTAARNRLQELCPDWGAVMTLEGDVCRVDLSLEIEGTWAAQVG